jgi:hypothetical protein
LPRKQPPQIPPQVKADIIRRYGKKAGDILNKIGNYIAQNQAYYARHGEPTWDEDMIRLVNRVGTGWQELGRVEQERIIRQCRSDPDSEFCQFIAGGHHIPGRFPPIGFVVEGERRAPAPAAKKRKKPQKQPAQIIYVIERER